MLPREQLSTTSFSVPEEFINLSRLLQSTKTISQLPDCDNSCSYDSQSASQTCIPVKRSNVDGQWTRTKQYSGLCAVKAAFVDFRTSLFRKLLLLKVISHGYCENTWSRSTCGLANRCRIESS